MPVSARRLSRAFGGHESNGNSSDVAMPLKPKAYPVVPKSALSLQPGEFWGLPLSNGTYGCGRVIDVPQSRAPGPSMLFLAGVLDWHSNLMPTEESIAAAACLEQGQAHVKVITQNGGRVLGYRDLSRDGITPWMFRGAESWMNSVVHKGLTPIRAQTSKDVVLPILSTWGLHVPCIIAEKRFLKRGRV